MSRIDLRGPVSSDAHGTVARLRMAVPTGLLVLAIYLATVFVPEGVISYALTIPPCLILIVTALARVNDLSLDMSSAAWNLRRGGLILVALYAVSKLTGPWLGVGDDWPTWRSVIGLWGFAMVWLTSPHQPPWGKYIWGGYTAPSPNHPHRRKEDDLDANP